MARGDQYGALGGLTQDQFGSLSKGFEMSNPVASLGGIGVSKGSALGYGLGLTGLSTTPVGIATTALDAYGKYSAEKAAQSALGQNKGFIDTVTGMVTNSAMDTARGMADTNKDGKVSQREAQNFGMQQGKLTSYEVGLNPAFGYTPNTVSVQGLAGFGKTDPTGGLGGVNTTGQVADVMTQQQVDDMFSGINTTSGVTGLGGGKGASYSGVTGFMQNPGVDPTGQAGQQTGTQTSHSGKGISFSDDAAASDSNDSTYICTALYEMGDMKKYIYKYDQIYGKRVDPLVYKGYCVWGEYVATKMRNKGLVYKIAKPLALAWAKQMAYDLSNGRYGKKSKVVKVISKVGEGICYALGFVSNIKQLIGEKYG